MLSTENESCVKGQRVPLGEKGNTLQECELKANYAAFLVDQTGKIFTFIQHNRYQSQVVKGRD